jgi:hypothetical protein
VAHNDSTGEQRDDSRQSKQLTQQVCYVSVEQDQAGLFDWMLVKRLINFENVA